MPKDDYVHQNISDSDEYDHLPELKTFVELAADPNQEAVFFSTVSAWGLKAALILNIYFCCHCEGLVPE